MGTVYLGYDGKNVRHVAVNHSGSVRVESREGEGSTFAFELPAAGMTKANRDIGAL